MSVKAIAVPAAANLILMPAPASFQKRSRKRRIAKVLSMPEPEVTWAEDYMRRVTALFSARRKMLSIYSRELKASFESKDAKAIRGTALELEVARINAEEMLFSELVAVVGRPE